MKIKQLCPPIIVTRMTGVAYASYDGKYTTLHYTDGTMESAEYPMDDENDNFFSIVGNVQRKARTSEATAQAVLKAPL